MPNETARPKSNPPRRRRGGPSVSPVGDLLALAVELRERALMAFALSDECAEEVDDLAAGIPSASLARALRYARDARDVANGTRLLSRAIHTRIAAVGGKVRR